MFELIGGTLFEDTNFRGWSRWSGYTLKQLESTIISFEPKIYLNVTVGKLFLCRTLRRKYWHFFDFCSRVIYGGSLRSIAMSFDVFSSKPHNSPLQSQILKLLADNKSIEEIILMRASEPYSTRASQIKGKLERAEFVNTGNYYYYHSNSSERAAVSILGAIWREQKRCTVILCMEPNTVP